MPYTPNTTWVDGSAGGTPLSAARLNNMEPAAFGAYFSYTPAWAASGTAPALGNGTLTGRYVQIGKHVHCYGRWLAGSSSTFGTGTYTFTIPVAAALTFQRGIGLGIDSSANALVQLTARVITSTTIDLLYPSTYLGVTANAGQLAPWTWASGDSIEWNIVYEAA